jgi:YD repeat-containing protein
MTPRSLRRLGLVAIGCVLGLPGSGRARGINYLLRIERYTADSSLSRVTTYAYNPDTNLVGTRIVDSTGELLYFTTYTYDDDGNRIARGVYDADSSESSRYEFEYDSLGREVQYRSIYEGELSMIYTTAYDSAGRKAEAVTYGPSMTELYREVHEYDTAGLLVRTLIRYPDSTQNLRTLYEYNDEGRLLSKVTRDSRDSLTDSMQIAYDSLGRSLQSGMMSYRESRRPGMPRSRTSFEAVHTWYPGGDTLRIDFEQCDSGEVKVEGCTNWFEIRHLGIPDTFVTPGEEPGPASTVLPVNVSVQDTTLMIELPSPAPRTIRVPIIPPADEAFLGLDVYTADTSMLVSAQLLYDTDTAAVGVTIRDGEENLVQTVQLAYDERGNLVGETVLDASEREMIRHEFAYDSSERCVGMEYYERGDRVRSTIFVYDDEGRLVVRKSYNRMMFLDKTARFAYDTAGRLTADTIGVSTGSYYHGVYEYDEGGSLTALRVYDSRDSLIREIAYTYTSAGRIDSITTVSHTRPAAGSPAANTAYLTFRFSDSEDRSACHLDIRQSRESLPAGAAVLHFGTIDSFVTVKLASDRATARRLTVRLSEGELLVESGRPLDQALTVELFDLAGRRIRRVALPDTRGARSVRVPVTSGRAAGSGTFVVRIRTHNRTIAKKLRMVK